MFQIRAALYLRLGDVMWPRLNETEEDMANDSEDEGQ